MKLTPLFKFLGLFQAGRRMDPPYGSFRRFTNAYKDKTGRIVTFGTGAPSTNSPNPSVGLPGPIVWNKCIFSSPFKGGVFQMLGAMKGADPVGCFKYSLNATGQGLTISQVYNTDHLMNLDVSHQYCPAGNFTSAVVNNKLFFNEYVDQNKYENTPETPTKRVVVSNLMKFDGAQVGRAGLPTPWRVVDPMTVALPGGALKYVRVMYFTLGLDGEIVFSNYTEATTSTVAVPSGGIPVYLGGYDVYPTTPHVDPAGTPGSIYPRYRVDGDSLFDGASPKYYNKKWAATSGAASYDANFNIILPLTQFSPGLTEGDWLFSLNLSNNFGNPYDAYMFQVESIVADTVTLKSKMKMFNAITVSWEDVDIATASATDQAYILGSRADNPFYSNINMLMFTSDTANGDFLLALVVPVLWDSNYSGIVVPPLYTPDLPRPILGTIVSNFDDMYDKTVTKTTFPPVIGITNFSNLLVGFDAVALYFQDISLGGSSEMVSGISNIIPYGSDFGDITAICGSETFLFMSRERKNYVITGELTTGQVNIKECDAAVGGAANARAVSNAFSDKVVFMNSTGVYEVTSSGAINRISADIEDLFCANTQSRGNPNDGNLFKRSIFKPDWKKRSDGFDGGIFKITLEDRRGFILFHTGEYGSDASRTLGQTNTLVYDTNDGTWYEFYGFRGASVESVEGLIYYYGSSIIDEREKMLSGLPVDEARQMLLLTQRITLGSPSLDKQVIQVKFYAYIEESGAFVASTIKIGQQNGFGDFVGGTLQTDVNYPKDNEFGPTSKLIGLYEHKQRFDSSKSPAFSVLIKTNNGELVALDGMEFEVETIQESLKK